MLSGKNIAYITLLAIAGVLIYHFFFKNKEEVAKFVSTLPETPKPTSTPNKDGDGDSSNSNRMPTPIVEKSSIEQAYVGPQDCAENCNLPYHNRILFCYNRMNGSNDCLKKAELLKQDCLGKCSDAIPRYKDLDEVVTPLQENNYSSNLFNNLFNQGYV